MHWIFAAALAAICLHSTSPVRADESADEAAFGKLDQNEDGVLSGKEVQAVRAYDADGDGEVSLREFRTGRARDQIKTTAEKSPIGSRTDANSLFQSLDMNEDGVLSGKELRGYEKRDSDGNGEVTQAEFLARPEPVKTSTESSVNAPLAAVDARAQAWTDQLSRQLDEGERWAVLIAINKYPTNPLRFCVPDAHLLADTLVKHGGLSRDHILLLTDDQESDLLRPRKANLQQRVPAFLRKAKSRDTVLVFYAGHGFAADGQSFLCPLDHDAQSPKLSGWRIDELRTILHDCAAGQKLMVIDCCHSGGVVTTSGFGASPQEVGRSFEQAQGLITFAACRTNQESAESAARGHGVFTDILAHGLSGEADFDRNGIVDSDELYRHVLVQVPIAVQEVARGHKQHPVRIIGQDVVGVFALARPNAKAAEKTAPGKTTPAKVELKPGDSFVNSIGMKLTVLPPAVCVLGSPSGEYLRDPEESLAPVVFSKPTVMGVHEVTQFQYERVIGANPSWFSPGGNGADEISGLKTDPFPVEQVSWNDAMRFCERLSELPSEKQAGRKYRLPTEAEREFACRAGSTTPFHTGEQLSPKFANIRGDRPYLSSPKGPTLGRTTTVGSYPPSAYGLYDMHGNVAEWCLDRLNGSQLANANNLNLLSIDDARDVIGLIEDLIALQGTNNQVQLPINPIGVTRGDPRAFRGGSFSGDVGFCRSASRREQTGDYRHRTIGFRVTCEIKK